MIRPILWKLWGTALIWIAWKSLRSSREFPWICDMIGWTLHEVKQCLFLQQSIDWKNLTTAALHYVGHVCDVVWAVSGNLHFDAPCAHTNSSIQLSSKYPLNPFEPVLLTSKYLSEGWTGTWTPPQKKKKNYTRMVSCMVSFFEKLRFVCFSRIFFSKDFKKRGAMQIAIARVHG